MRNVFSCIAVGSVLLLWAGSVSALAIYRWVDEAGVVHFSDMPSVEAPHPFKTVDIEEPPVADSRPAGEIDDIRVAAETSRSLREELDELREELRAQRQAARERRLQAPLQVVQSLQPVTYGWPYGYGRNGNHHPSAKPDMPQPQPTEIKTATWKPPGGS